MFDRWNRFAPLAGVAYTVLVLLGGLVLEGNGPDTSTSGRDVIAFYTTHQTAERAGAIVVAFAFVALLIFASALRDRYRSWRAADGVASLSLASAVILVVGQTIRAGLIFTLTSSPDSLGQQSAGTLNRLTNDLVLTSAVGFLSFGVLSGMLILGTRTAPAWLGWFAIVTGLLFLFPAAEFVGFLASLVWICCLGTYYYRRAESTARLTELTHR
jgi:hypothetical protein